MARSVVHLQSVRPKLRSEILGVGGDSVDEEEEHVEIDDVD